jgi:CheY-like chemotaxis protein
MGRTIFHAVGVLMDDVPPILVVEDEPLVRLSIIDALEGGGYTVIEAEDGGSAIEQIDNAGQLRGLVTDIRMGASPNGWEVAHHAREKFPALAVVYVTGDSITEWPVEGVPQSIVLQKPFASVELVTGLASLLVNSKDSAQH